jgi:hypothetical protein
MTRAEIIRMARKVWPVGGLYAGPTFDSLEQFAALVAAAERGACKAIADQYSWCQEAKFIAAKIQDRA